MFTDMNMHALIDVTFNTSYILRNSLLALLKALCAQILTCKHVMYACTCTHSCQNTHSLYVCVFFCLCPFVICLSTSHAHAFKHARTHAMEARVACIHASAQYMLPFSFTLSCLFGWSLFRVKIHSLAHSNFWIHRTVFQSAQSTHISLLRNACKNTIGMP
jgi:hypothetical protein